MWQAASAIGETDATYATGTVEDELLLVAWRLRRLAVAEQNVVDGDARVKVFRHRLLDGYLEGFAFVNQAMKLMIIRSHLR